jgi:hypothetical protein
MWQQKQDLEARQMQMRFAQYQGGINNTAAFLGNSLLASSQHCYRPPNPHRERVKVAQCQGCGAWGDTSCRYCGNPIKRAG